MALESFNAYHSYLEAISPLNDEERGRLFTALLLYSKTGECPHLTGNERFIFPSMKGQIDRDRQKYEAKCARNRDNVKRRWESESCVPIRSYTNDAKDKEEDKDKEKEKDKDKDKDSIFLGDRKKSAKRFTPPTVDQVREYCMERRNMVDPQRFVDFYESKGWVVGKSKMKDWKAAVRTWEKEDSKNAGNSRNDRAGRPDQEIVFPGIAVF